MNIFKQAKKFVEREVLISLLTKAENKEILSQKKFIYSFILNPFALTFPMSTNSPNFFILFSLKISLIFFGEISVSMHILDLFDSFFKIKHNLFKDVFFCF